VFELVRKFYSARWILILGGDQAAVLAEFLEYALQVIGLPALSALTSGRIVHNVRHVTARDIVIAISYGRGLRQTVEGLEQARENGAYCVAISDTPLSSLMRFAQEYFITPVENPSFAGSYVAPMALFNIILVTCANYRKARTIAQLKKAEEEQRTGFRWYSAKY
jgi:DNA-binding MurR/RpiR family transcriptional regulator